MARFRVGRLLRVPIAAMEAKFAKVTKQWLESELGLESELADAPAQEDSHDYDEAPGTS